jgi:hypothetical protein|tara:strand:+ start:384 stop:599 length:216 start_codon:yes stop_codon:yes gene_type:complete
MKDRVPDPPPYSRLGGDSSYLKTPRQYRQEDGTLGPKRPPRKAYVVAARREWVRSIHWSPYDGVRVVNADP